MLDQKLYKFKKIVAEGMNKLLSIVGPTATGKTNLALFITQKLIKDSAQFPEDQKIKGVDLISLDSRQVYQGLKIISGADVPKKFKLQTTALEFPDYPYYANQDQTIRLHGVSILKPNEEWSVSHFQEFAQKLIAFSWQTGYLPILVGGTGLYYQHLFNPDTHLKVKPDLKLRQKAEQMDLEALQQRLIELNKTIFENMNHSDKNNPRRLIRKIEILLHQNKVKANQLTIQKPNKSLTFLLMDELKTIKEKIEKRVEKRFKNGAIDEVKNLYQKYEPQLSALSATGVKEIKQFLDQETSEEECLKLWTLREYQYAKRQITWWKNKKNITVLNLKNKDYQQQALELVEKQLMTISK